MRRCQPASKVQHVQTCHRLVLIASFFHRHLASPRTLASKFRAEGTRIACLSLNDNACIASPVEPHIHIAAHGFQYTPFLVCFCLVPLSYNPRSLFEQSTLLHIPSSYLADGPSTNAVYALASHARSRPSIHHSFHLKLNTDQFPELHRRAGLSPATFFLSFSLSYSQIFVAYLSVSRTYKYHRPVPHRIIRSSRHQRPPFSLSCVRFYFSFLFPSDPSETASSTIDRRR